MAEKVPVLVMVDPDVGTTIQPFASSIAVLPANQDKSVSGTGTVTGTYNNGNYDADGTID